jgi:hypothetical protein
MLKITSKVTSLVFLTVATIVASPSAYAATLIDSIVIPFSDWVTNPSQTVGDKTFTYKDSTNLPDNAPDSVIFEAFDNDEYLFTYDFIPGGSSSTFTLEYEVTINDPNKFFTAVDLDSDVLNFTPDEELTATYTGGTSPVVLKSLNGSSDIKPVAGQPKTITVFNNYNANGGGPIETFSNSFKQGEKVPEPSMLLGFGLIAGLAALKKNGKKASTLKNG